MPGPEQDIRDYLKSRGQQPGKELDLEVRDILGAMRISGRDVNQFKSLVSQIEREGGTGDSLQEAIHSSAFGTAFSEAGGSMSSVEAERLDRELRRRASRSTTTNIMGAVLAMTQKDGPIDDKLLARLRTGDDQQKKLASFIDALQSKDTKALAGFASIDSTQFLGMTESAGLNKWQVQGFMDNSAQNQKLIQQLGLGEQVRTLQNKAEADQFLATQMGASVLGSMVRNGVGRESAQTNLPQITSYLTGRMRELAKSNPEYFTDPKKAEERNALLTKELTEKFPDLGMKEPEVAGLVSNALTAAEAGIRSDQDLKKFKDVKGLIDVTNPDITAAGRNRDLKFEEDVTQVPEAQERRKKDVAAAGGGDMDLEGSVGVSPDGRGRLDARGNGNIRVTGSLNIKPEGPPRLESEGAGSVPNA